MKNTAEIQHKNLVALKEHIEKEELLSQFIPSIPPSNGRISSSFGWRKDPFHGQKRMHNGIDFVDQYAAPVYATANGTVISAKVNSGYGKQIIINHGNGYKTSYSHLSSYEVAEGDIVTKGEIIGRMGSTGRSTGVHLHYEVHLDGKVMNPTQYIKGENFLVRKENTK